MFQEENDQLLDTLENPEDGEQGPSSPSAKPGTKAALVEKIRELEERHNIIVEESKRKSKKELQETLAKYVEAAMQQEIVTTSNVLGPPCQQQHAARM